MMQTRVTGQDQQAATAVQTANTQVDLDQNAVEPKTQSLESVAKLIAADARCNSLQYLVRSNTSHDGE